MFEDKKKFRNAELISPPNTLQQKVGSGGLDITIIQRAQELLQNTTTDLEPIAEMFLDVLDEQIYRARKREITDEEAIENIIYPTMQLKGQGTMFHYPIVTQICGILISFLEVVPKLNEDAFDVIMAHKMTLKAVLKSKIKDNGGLQGKALINALKDACLRYFQTHH